MFLDGNEGQFSFGNTYNVTGPGGYSFSISNSPDEACTSAITTGGNYTIKRTTNNGTMTTCTVYIPPCCTLSVNLNVSGPFSSDCTLLHYLKDTPEEKNLLNCCRYTFSPQVSSNCTYSLQWVISGINNTYYYSTTSTSTTVDFQAGPAGTGLEYSVCLTATTSTGQKTTCKNYRVTNGNTCQLNQFLLDPNETFIQISDDEIDRIGVIVNPEYDYIKLSLLDNVNYEILYVDMYDLYGRKVLSSQFRQLELEKQINTNELKQGLYFLTVASKDKIYHTQKIFIK